MPASERKETPKASSPPQQDAARAETPPTSSTSLSMPPDKTLSPTVSPGPIHTGALRPAGGRIAQMKAESAGTVLYSAPHPEQHAGRRVEFFPQQRPVLLPIRVEGMSEASITPRLSIHAQHSAAELLLAQRSYHEAVFTASAECACGSCSQHLDSPVASMSTGQRPYEPAVNGCTCYLERDHAHSELLCMQSYFGAAAAAASSRGGGSTMPQFFVRNAPQPSHVLHISSDTNLLPNQTQGTETYLTYRSSDADQCHQSVSIEDAAGFQHEQSDQVAPNSVSSTTTLGEVNRRATTQLPVRIRQPNLEDN